jgi:hypothetical protein
MTRSDSVTGYLMKVMQSHDQLAVVGKKVVDAKMVNMALNGFLASREPFVKGICARKNLPNFERLPTIVKGLCARESLPNFEKLLDDYIQEETLMESKANKKGGEENLAIFD